MTLRDHDHACLIIGIGTASAFMRISVRDCLTETAAVVHHVVPGATITILSNDGADYDWRYSVPGDAPCG